MVFFLVNQFAGKLQRRPNVITCQTVFAFDLLKAHSAGQAANDLRNRHPRAANHRFSVTNSWVDNDSVVHVRTNTTFGNRGKVRMRTYSPGKLCGYSNRYFFFCTLAATFNRSAFNRMNPVASSWLYALVGSASIVAMCGL